jgi:hypothetical protein
MRRIIPIDMGLMRNQLLNNKPERYMAGQKKINFRKYILKAVIYLAALQAVMLLIAGRMDYWQGWVH